MPSVRKIPRLIVAGVHLLTGRRDGPPPVEGIPEGLEPGTLNQICRNRLGESLSSVSYVHVSGWKASGAFRLFLVTQSGRKQQLIFKNSVFRQEEIPALRNLSVTPGRTEYRILSSAAPGLSRYLPEVYLAEEIARDSHYQYLMDDLSENYWGVDEPDDLLQAVRELPAIERAMTGWIDETGDDGLLKYDENFSVSLHSYFEENMPPYAAVTRDEAVLRALDKWPLIARAHSSRPFAGRLGRVPVHGDFNTSNVLIHKKDRSRIKLLDWEWAGTGIPHQEVASLLTGSGIAVERLALDALAGLYPGLTREEHLRVYRWCQLERSLLDAAFLASQHLYAAARASFDLPAFVARSLNRALRVAGELA